MALLEVDGVTIGRRVGRQSWPVVRDVSLKIDRGQTLGIVGETGSGKSLTLRAIVDALPPQFGISEGRVLFDGKDVTGKSGGLRGSSVTMILQDPMTALNPVLTVSEQVAETLKATSELRGDAAAKRALELMQLVGIRDAKRVLGSYPHQLSGGMAQRVVIAIAISANPLLLLADEPTTALDVTIQAQILKLLGDLQRQLGMAMILVSHDLGVVAQSCDRIAVMYAGRFVEEGRSLDVFERQSHPYTVGLFDSTIRSLGARSSRLRAIPGSPPAFDNLPTGCAFRPRCAWATDACSTWEAELRAVDTDRAAACLRSAEVSGRPAPADEDRRDHPAGQVDPDKAPVLSLNGVHKRYLVWSPRHLLRRDSVTAVSGVDFAVRAGEIVGLVGESGSGKSTLARLAVWLEKPDTGDVEFEGQSIEALERARRREIRRDVQMVYQDPYSSLNPRMRVGAALAEAVWTGGVHDSEVLSARVAELLRLVEMPEDTANRFPRHLSGGQRQRVGIARALAVNPRVVVADEPVSSLDVSVQAQILNLILRLRAELDVAWIFIGHNLGVVNYVADRIAVMYNGRIVEQGDGSQVLRDPLHPYTKELVQAIPSLDPRVKLTTGSPSPLHPQAAADGCSYAPRCPLAKSQCFHSRPELLPVHGARDVACWAVTDAEKWSAREQPATVLEGSHDR